MSDRDGVLREDLESKVDALAESVSVLQDDVATIKQTNAQILEIVRDLYPIRSVATDHTDILKDHEARLVDLEYERK